MGLGAGRPQTVGGHDVVARTAGELDPVGNSGVGTAQGQTHAAAVSGSINGCHGSRNGGQAEVGSTCAFDGDAGSTCGANMGRIGSGWFARGCRNRIFIIFWKRR